MKTIKLISPDGSAEVDAHPSRVESMLANGWKKADAEKPKAKPKARKTGDND
jgi:hypothetical protein